MALGVSHYASPEEWNPDFTNFIVRDCYLNPEYGHEGWKNTYTKFGCALAGRELSETEKNDLWNSFMFWNFIQEPMSDSKKQPSDEQIAVGQKAFLEMLEEYKPERIIVWSKKLYEWLPDKGHQGEEVKLAQPWKDGKIYTQETWVYPLSDGTICKVMPVEPHPSGGFAWDYWHEMISQFLEN